MASARSKAFLISSVPTNGEALRRPHSRRCSCTRRLKCEPVPSSKALAGKARRGLPLRSRWGSASSPWIILTIDKSGSSARRKVATAKTQHSSYLAGGSTWQSMKSKQQRANGPVERFSLQQPAKSPRKKTSSHEHQGSMAAKRPKAHPNHQHTGAQGVTPVKGLAGHPRERIE